MSDLDDLDDGIVVELDDPPPPPKSRSRTAAMSGRTPRGAKRRYHHNFPVELYDWLAEQAELRGVSMALLVNRAVEHYRTILPPPPPRVGDVDDMLGEATAALRAGR